MTRPTLNEGQQAAARALAGRVLVTAGAGSGKTRVLTERFVNAVLPDAVAGWTPLAVDEIVAITFTDKAAGELADRVRAALRGMGLVEQAQRVDAAWISTIHGLCSRLLKRYALEASLDPAFRVADTVAAGRLREKAFELAAQPLLRTDEAVVSLFGEYPFDALFRATTSLHAESSIRDLRPEDIIAGTPESATDLIEEAIAVFETCTEGLRGCGGTQVTVTNHIDACGDMLDALRALRKSPVREYEAAGELWRVLLGYSARKGTTKASEETLRRMFAERQRLAREAAGLLTARLARGLITLVGEYGRSYEAMKQAQSLLDFDDLQRQLTALLARDHALAARLRERFRMVMVDEFQDTDALQLAIVDRLSSEWLCTVGDERQAIYGFRGADIDVYREHISQMRDKGAEQVELTENYRSHRDILAFVNILFGAGAFFGDDLVRLSASREEPVKPLLPNGAPRVEVLVAAREGKGDRKAREVLADAVAERFARLRDERGFDPADMVILLRSYTHADVYAAALRRHGFPALTVGGRRFFGLPETMMLTALVQVLANPDDESATATLLASQMGGLSDDGLLQLRVAANEAGHATLWQSAADVGSSLHARDREALARVVGAVIRARADLGALPLGTLILRVVEECDYDTRLLGLGDAGRDAYANVLKFARMADAFEAEGGVGPAGFVTFLADKQRYGEQQVPATLADERSPAVRLMSIHSSKGLEFGVVAVPELDSGRNGGGFARFAYEDGQLHLALKLPSGWDAGTEDLDKPMEYVRLEELAERTEADESRRLFYVAATRAEEYLLLGGWRPLDKECEREDMFGSMSRVLGIAGPLRPGESERELADGAEAVRLTLRVVEAGSVDTEACEDEEGVEGGEGAGSVMGSRAAGSEDISPPVTPVHLPPVPRRLSYTGVAGYQRCGRRFLAESVLGMGRLCEQQAGSAAGFGSAVHAALQLAVDGKAPADARLDALARFHGLDDDARLRLDRVVQAYLASPLAERVAAYLSVRREAPFAVALGEPQGGGFVLDGTMDVYAHDDDRALIVDYKTGESGDESTLRGRYELQARCYALAALRDGRSRVEVVFVRPEVPVDGRPQEIEFAFRSQDADAIESDLREMYARMCRGEYEARESWDESACSDCSLIGESCPRPLRRHRTAG